MDLLKQPRPDWKRIGVRPFHMWVRKNSASRVEMVWGKPRANDWQFRVIEHGETIAKGYCNMIGLAMEAAEKAPRPLPGSTFDLSKDHWNNAPRC